MVATPLEDDGFDRLKAKWFDRLNWRKNWLCVSDPHNLRRTCESLSLQEVETYWNGRLLQLEL